MNLNTIRELASAFQESRILLSAVELDLFTSIKESGISSQLISEKLQINPHACERLLNALVSLKILTKHKDLFFNTSESFNFLSKKSRNYQGGLMHTNHLWNTWSHLTEVVRTGVSAHPDEINERSADWLFAFINAMHDRAKRQAPQQLSDVDLTGIKTILDIGGGSGAYSMQFITQNSGIKATAFDLPNVIPITKKFIDQDGFTGKIDTYPGDYTKDELPSGFDLVFLSAIIHSNSLETNRDLIRKCFKSLNKGGKIIIQDWIMNDDRTQPISGAIFAINMLVGTESGDCFTEQEVKAMLKDAGFRNISRKEFDSGLSQLTARKI